MENYTPDPGRLAKRIIEDEGLPQDLLERAATLPRNQDESLFDWVMQLREVLAAEEENHVKDVLNDGVLISSAGSESISRKVATLTRDLRASLRRLIQGESAHREQATFLLAMDVQNRVHNKVRGSS